MDDGMHACMGVQRGEDEMKDDHETIANVMVEALLLLLQAGGVMGGRWPPMYCIHQMKNATLLACVWLFLICICHSVSSAGYACMHVCMRYLSIYLVCHSESTRLDSDVRLGRETPRKQQSYVFSSPMWRTRNAKTLHAPRSFGAQQDIRDRFNCTNKQCSCLFRS